MNPQHKVPSARVESVAAGEVALLRVAGKIKIGAGEMVLRDAVEDALKRGSKEIVLDLKEVTTIDSSGVGELVSSYTGAANRGARIRLSGLPAKIHDILTITQLITVFDVYATSDEAIHSALSRQHGEPDTRLIVPVERTPEGLFLVAEEESPRIIAPILIDTNRVLAQSVLREPESLYRLPPRKFEEFIAAILEDLGWEVNLTPATSDGGRDIIAVVPSEIGSLLCLVEVKRYRQDRKVGVELVRQLYGTVAHEEASYGLLVTSSSFSKEAMRFEQAHKYRIGLKDFSHVLEWTRRFCRESP